jgi:hypothetical protein
MIATDATFDEIPPARIIVGPGGPVVRPHNPGLVIFHDQRNERFPRSAVHPLSAPFVPRTVHHRQYRRYDQGATPRCTAYASTTLLAAARPFNAPPISADEWYVRNVQHDQREGRFFDEGATVVAAMEVGRALGVYKSYRWIYTVAEMQRAILDGPIVLGTLWYPSMWQRRADGVVYQPPSGEEAVGGHMWIVNAYDHRRDLWRHPSTWGDGDYEIPGDLMHRLLHEEGEATQPEEIDITP